MIRVFCGQKFRRSVADLFADWLDSEPDVPNEKWFKRFPEMIVCGEGELVKTFLNARQIPVGKEIFFVYIDPYPYARGGN